MPLRKLFYGPNAGSRECILGKWELDPTGISGSYTQDPVEKCLFCNFYDAKNKKHPLEDEEACRCPPWMNWGIYDYLRDTFGEKGDGKTTTFHKLLSELSEKNLTDLNSIKKARLASIIKNEK